MKVICPLMTTYNSAGDSVLCQGEGCALWDQIRLECAFLSISEELSDLRAEGKQKRMSEILKEGN